MSFILLRKHHCHLHMTFIMDRETLSMFTKVQIHLQHVLAPVCDLKPILGCWRDLLLHRILAQVQEVLTYE